VRYVTKSIGEQTSGRGEQVEIKMLLRTTFEKNMYICYVSSINNNTISSTETVFSGKTFRINMK
jgi:hypothetical protein